MCTLRVVGYDGPYQAEEVRLKRRKLQRESLIDPPSLRKSISAFLLALVSLALVAGSTGCATSKDEQAAQQREKEQWLVSAGFKVIAATTPEQQQMLRTLPADRVSAVRRKGQLYFVYPVPAQNVLYLGKNSQYLDYRFLAQQPREQALVKQEVESINRSLASPGWEAPWGDWDAQ